MSFGLVTAPGATHSIDTDSYTTVTLTGLSAALAVTLRGGPVEGQKLLVGFKDNGTPRAITWDASVVASGVAVPLATTVAGKIHWVLLVWDGAHWVCLAVDAVGY